VNKKSLNHKELKEKTSQRPQRISKMNEDQLFNSLISFNTILIKDDIYQVVKTYAIFFQRNIFGSVKV
jgi:hypothetical protein